MLQTVCGQVIAADSLMKIAWLSEFLSGGLMVVGGLYPLYSGIWIQSIITALSTDRQAVL
ncbi:MAG: hypothetical protein AB8B64_26350 [Granulosicoccus sp.]